MLAVTARTVSKVRHLALILAAGLHATAAGADPIVVPIALPPGTGLTIPDTISVPPPRARRPIHWG